MLGTGGYDTIILLVNDDQETMSTIKKFLEKWSKEKGSNINLLGTRGELRRGKKGRCEQV